MAAWLRKIRRRRMVLGVAVVLLLSAVGGGLWWLTGSASSPDRPPVASAQPSATPLTAQRAASLVADVTSGDAVRVRRAIAMPSGQALDPAATAALAKLRITIDPATFVANGARTATVSATVTGVDGRPTPTVFALLYTTDGWQLVDTTEAG